MNKPSSPPISYANLALGRFETARCYNFCALALENKYHNSPIHKELAKILRSEAEQNALLGYQETLIAFKESIDASSA